MASGCDRVQQQALGCFLVLGELPDAPIIGKEGRKPSLRADREAVRPALLGNLRRVALGNCPGARRIHDQGATARNQPLVVGGVVPRRRIRRQECHQLLVDIRAPAARCRSSRRHCPWRRRLRRRRRGRRRPRYRRCRWSHRGRCRRERRPCGKLRQPSGRRPSSRRRLSALNPLDTSPGHRYRHVSSSGQCASRGL